MHVALCCVHKLMLKMAILQVCALYNLCRYRAFFQVKFERSWADIQGHPESM